VEIRETLKRRKALQEITKIKIAQQDEEIAEITGIIDEKQKDVNDRLKRVEAARQLNVHEDDKHRRLGRINAAHKAKMDFIEEKYDYKSQAKGMALQDFKELVESNIGVNSALSPFQLKLAEVQKEI